MQESTRGCIPFSLVLQGVTGATDNYLFLNVKVGNDEIIALRDKLYSGLLKRYVNRTITYIPHLTVGKCTDEELFHAAVDETAGCTRKYETVVQEIVSELIEPSGQSSIEIRMPLSLSRREANSLK